MKKIIFMAAIAAAAMTALSCAQTPDLSGEWKVVTINGVEIEAPETEDEVEIGRASCRERVLRAVDNSVVAV